MKKIILKKISFGSYMKLTFICSIALPLVMSVIAFIGVLFGGSVAVNEGLIPYPMSILYGGAIALLFPVVWGLAFCLFAIFMFLPFRLVVYLFKGIRIKAFIEISDDEDNKTKD